MEDRTIRTHRYGNEVVHEYLGKQVTSEDFADLNIIEVMRKNEEVLRDSSLVKSITVVSW